MECDIIVIRVHSSSTFKTLSWLDDFSTIVHIILSFGRKSLNVNRKGKKTEKMKQKIEFITSSSYVL